MSLQADFDAAAAKVKTLPNLDNDQLLSLYKLFKQASAGDCNTNRPGMFDFTGKAKWDAWNSMKGTNKEEAQRMYIAIVADLS